MKITAEQLAGMVDHTNLKAFADKALRRGERVPVQDGSDQSGTDQSV